MNFATRRYFWIPLVPGPKITVDGRTLSLHRWFGQPRRIPLDGLSVEMSYGGVSPRGALNRLTGCGNLSLVGSVVGSNGLVVSNAYKIKGLLSAAAGAQEATSAGAEGLQLDKALASFELQIPRLPPSLLSVLERRRPAASTLMRWDVAEGDTIRAGAVIGGFCIDWKGIKWRGFSKKHHREVQNATLKMPFDGRVTFISKDESDACLLTVRPFLEDKYTLDFMQKNQGMSREEYERYVCGFVSLKEFYWRAREALWLILDRAGNDSEPEEREDADDIINREIALIRPVVMQAADTD